MSNAQLFLSIGIPSVLVLIGILLNQLGQSRLETRIQIIEGDLRRFYELLGEHSGKLDLWEKGIK